MKKKLLSVALSACMAIGLALPAFAAEEAPANPWQTPEGYGSVTANADGTYTMKGAEELDDNNAHCGPYTKEGATSLADGIKEKLDIFINPAQIAAAEKFAVSVSLNDKEGEYATEFLVNFQKSGDAVTATAGLAPNFTANIAKAGLYTLVYEFSEVDAAVVAKFSIEKNGEAVATTGDITLDVNPADCGTRGYIWFVDISVADGLKVGTPKTQEAQKFVAEDWTTGEGYGSIEVKNDNMAIFKGEEEMNSDANHSGPNTKAKAALLKDGTIVDEVNFFLDPAALKAGEKFQVSAALDNMEGNYLTELVVMFQKGNDDSVIVRANPVAEDLGKITEAGLYTLRYTFVPAGNTVLGNVYVLKDGKEVASATDIVMPGATEANTKGRRYIWFCDISVEGGLAVYSDTAADYSKVDEALAKVPEDLSIYTDETAKAVEDAVAAVVRDKNALEQDVVDGYAKAINDAVAALVEKDPKPATGEATELLIPAACLLIAAAGIAVMLFSKKREAARHAK